MSETSEKSFETIIESRLLENGYRSVPQDGFDREQAIFPQQVLTFIRSTQSKAWEKLEALHGEKTGERVLHDLCGWIPMDRWPRYATVSSVMVAHCEWPFSRRHTG